MTDAISAAVERFMAEEEIFKRAAKRVERTVQSVADAAQIKAHVSGRAKDIRSFQKKLLIKQYADPWADLSDKIGVRAVVQAPSDVDRLSRELQLFYGSDCLRIEDKRQVMNPAELAYSGVHMQVIASSPRGKDPIECEIQLRTTAQDAWSVVSHRLLYKPLVSLPPEAQHAAYRLVALVELFDAEVQRLMDTYASVSDGATAELIDMVESRFLALAHSPSNSELSVLILNAIHECIPSSDLKRYAGQLDEFISQHDTKLNGLYEEYGAHKIVNYMPEYVLFGQAESLIILERLQNRPHKLTACWRRSDLPDTYLEALAGAAGMDLPDY